MAENGGEAAFDVGRLTTYLSVFAAFAYAVGVVAINTYLHELGIVDFSFAKPKLLLTGILVLFTFILLAAPPVLFAWSRAGKDVAEYRISRRGILVSAVVFLVLLVCASLWFFRKGPGMGQITAWEIWALVRKLPFMKTRHFFTNPAISLAIAATMYVPVLAAAGAVYGARRLFREASSEASRGMSLRWFYFAVAAGFVVLSVIGYIYVFVGTFYPAIPQGFGGGEPYYESLVIAAADQCPMEELGVPFSRGSVTLPLPVLHETDTVIAVWLKQGKTAAVTADEGGSAPWTSRFVVAELDKSEITAMTISNVVKGEQIPPLTPQVCAGSGSGGNQ